MKSSSYRHANWTSKGAILENFRHANGKLTKMKLFFKAFGSHLACHLSFRMSMQNLKFSYELNIFLCEIKDFYCYMSLLGLDYICIYMPCFMFKGAKKMRNRNETFFFFFSNKYLVFFIFFSIFLFYFLGNQS